MDKIEISVDMRRANNAYLKKLVAEAISGGAEIVTSPRLAQWFGVGTSSRPSPRVKIDATTPSFPPVEIRDPGRVRLGALTPSFPPVETLILVFLVADKAAQFLRNAVGTAKDTSELLAKSKKKIRVKINGKEMEIQEGDDILVRPDDTTNRTSR
jgi:hypothetical protein